MELSTRAEIRITNARTALKAIEQRLAELEGEHYESPRDYGIVGAIGYVEKELIVLCRDIGVTGLEIIRER